MMMMMLMLLLLNDTAADADDVIPSVDNADNLPPLLAIQFRSFFFSSLAKMSHRDKTLTKQKGDILK